MTGLEKILAEISGEAQAARESELEKARAQAQAIQKEEERKTALECDRIAAQNKKACEDLMQRERSGADLKKRSQLLAERQRLIQQTMKGAADTVITMPDDQYFDIMVKVAAQNAQPGEGLMYISSRDHKRLPQGYMERVNAALPEGCTLKLQQEPRRMYGGMILVYGGIEENCSLRAMYGARREDLVDIASHLLFD